MRANGRRVFGERFLFQFDVKAATTTMAEVSVFVFPLARVFDFEV